MEFKEVGVGSGAGTGLIWLRSRTVGQLLWLRQ